MSDFLAFLMFAGIVSLSLAAGFLVGYGHGWRAGVRDAARSARFSASLRGSMDLPSAKALAEFADRQERRVARYERTKR